MLVSGAHHSACPSKVLHRHILWPDEGLKTNTWPFPASSHLPICLPTNICSLISSCCNVQVSWGMMIQTAQEGNGLWQAPRQDIFVFQEHPRLDVRVISGSVKIVATSDCNSASELFPLPSTSAPCLPSALGLKRMINTVRKLKGLYLPHPNALYWLNAVT